MLAHGFKISSAVRTGLEPATPGVTGRYSNQTELPHQKRCKINPIFHSSKFFPEIYFSPPVHAEKGFHNNALSLIDIIKPE